MHRGFDGGYRRISPYSPSPARPGIGLNTPILAPPGRASIGEYNGGLNEAHKGFGHIALLGGASNRAKYPLNTWVQEGPFLGSTWEV